MINLWSYSSGCIYTKYSGRQVWADFVDQDQIPHNTASHQGIYFLSLIHQFNP